MTTAQRVSIRVWVKNLRPEKEFFFPYLLVSERGAIRGQFLGGNAHLVHGPGGHLRCLAGHPIED